MQRDRAHLAGAGRGLVEDDGPAVRGERRVGDLDAGGGEGLLDRRGQPPEGTEAGTVQICGTLFLSAFLSACTNATVLPSGDPVGAVPVAATWYGT
ncbi:hypothetical protein ABIA31_001917 [Catenulispora sp. MAP5-51]|uniref:hypothetical protein n=1 Tax=Catenulispora sp. MAP5-51 TaxID=3156298 RepID=UPI0035138B14